MHSPCLFSEKRVSHLSEFARCSCNEFVLCKMCRTKVAREREEVAHGCPTKTRERDPRDGTSRPDSLACGRDALFRNAFPMRAGCSRPCEEGPRPPPRAEMPIPTAPDGRTQRDFSREKSERGKNGDSHRFPKGDLRRIRRVFPASSEPKVWSVARPSRSEEKAVFLCGLDMLANQPQTA